MKLFLDIETIPTQKPNTIEEIRATLSPPGNIKKQETIDKWWLENGEAAIQEKYRATALDSSKGEILTIGWAINDNPVEVLWRDHNDAPEEQLIVAFFEKLSEQVSNRKITQWIGHNIAEFDIRYIWHRCIINRVKPSVELPVHSKPWEGEIFDTMTYWTGHVTKRISQSNLCKALGIPLDETEIDGSQVWEYAQRGEFKEIIKHNKNDVENVRNMYKRLTFDF